jgi:hypothetical protein
MNHPLYRAVKKQSLTKEEIASYLAMTVINNLMSSEFVHFTKMSGLSQTIVRLKVLPVPFAHDEPHWQNGPNGKRHQRNRHAGAAAEKFVEYRPGVAH